MNKIKTLYDMVQALKNEATIKGQFKLTVKQDDVTVLDSDNRFEKNLLEGRMCGRHHGMHRGHHDFKGHMHAHNHAECSDGMNEKRSQKMKHMHHERPGKLDRLSMVLDMLNRLDLTSEEDKKRLKLQMNIKDMPEMMKAHMARGHKRVDFNGIHGIKEGQVDLDVLINSDNSIESVDYSLSGSTLDEEGQTSNHEITGSLKIER